MAPSPQGQEGEHHVNSKKKRLLVDEVRSGRYVRAWKERRETVVQIWNGGEPTGEPDGDWVMPSVLPLELAVEQSILQTPRESIS